MYSYKYPRPALTTDGIVLKKESKQLLLIQRGIEPYKGKWALPGGFMEMDELLVDACKRELMEETGLEVLELTQFTAADKVDRDPRGRTISILFYGYVAEDAVVKGGDDAAKAEWFPIDDLPELAFDHADLIARFKREILSL
ncbi:NUDIX domain-containing protein [Mangrovibacterium diazotrophicum]|uniref:8-oxo-dGTP diphosphatase n=1 Tax=Mangrovibacterium diazotrophicum TaxID=1261403 RepID=A0A419W4V9_9BACT|nr:NUDIX hydrolase [Mangrovibacterium diazotrophicum]RKD90498.1 8-oxo-dGTP diphosphatase [Mangrovibacterium diazotrophicum]